MSEYNPRSDAPEVSGWALGGITFAGVMMILIGCFQIIAGLVAIIDDEFYVVTKNYTFDIDTTAWGWIHLLIGALLLLSGAYLFAGRTWAAHGRAWPARLAASVSMASLSTSVAPSVAASSWARRASAIAASFSE